MVETVSTNTVCVILTPVCMEHVPLSTTHHTSVPVIEATLEKTAARILIGANLTILVKMVVNVSME